MFCARSMAISMTQKLNVFPTSSKVMTIEFGDGERVQQIATRVVPIRNAQRKDAPRRGTKKSLKTK